MDHATTTKRIASEAALVLALPLALMAWPAQAGFVTNWNYDVETGWVNWQDDKPGDGITESGSFTFTNSGDTGYKKLEWGVPVDPPPPSEPSSLVVEDTAVSGTIGTNDGFENTTEITHNNFVITTASPELQKATLQSELTLSPDPVVPGFFSSVFKIQFEETPNDGSCGFGSVSNCDDIFILTNPGALTTTFSYDDGDGADLYQITIGIEGLTSLPGNACEIVLGSGNTDCLGLLTQEGEENSFDAKFKIATVVPAPGTLSILALGLACMLVAGLVRKYQTSY